MGDPTELWSLDDPTESYRGRYKDESSEPKEISHQLLSRVHADLIIGRQFT